MFQKKKKKKCDRHYNKMRHLFYYSYQFLLKIALTVVFRDSDSNSPSL